MTSKEESVAAFSFRMMMLDYNNQVCFDCGAKDPTMAVLKFGVFICEDCAKVHDTFDSSIGLARSIHSDDWAFRELNLMSLGGNLYAHRFLKQHGWSWTGREDLEAKYTSEAAALFRKLLLDEVDQQNGPETSLASSSVDLLGCGVNEPPPIGFAQDRIDQVTIQESDEARRRFPIAKSISSAQFFGYEEKMHDTEAKHRLLKFANATSISSVEFFGFGVKKPSTVNFKKLKYFEDQDQPQVNEGIQFKTRSGSRSARV